MFRVLIGVLLLPVAAFADGALPDSLAIALPADNPHEIFAGTNFGLLVSTDDGAHFDWVCEEAIGSGAYLFQLGPAPDDILYALSLDGLSYSTDDGCSWQHGQIPGELATDVFPAPTDAQRVFAIVQPPQGDASFITRHVYESNDHGQTFTHALYGPDAGELLTGIELARSAPELWATLYQYQPTEAFIARSVDDGGTWSTLDLGLAQIPRLLAVDPTDPGRVYLRLSLNASVDALARWDDATQALTMLKPLEDKMSAFVLRADGTVLVSQLSGKTWSSHDGVTFELADSSSHLRALAERDGTLFALADNFGDGWAVGTSSDGKSWKHLFQYGQIRGVRQCGNLAQTCAQPWIALQSKLGLGAKPKPTGCACDSSNGAWLLAALLLVARLRHSAR
ncbi:MAG: sialidase family protein [Myxococcaceae bacterium]